MLLNCSEVNTDFSSDTDLGGPNSNFQSATRGRGQQEEFMFCAKCGNSIEPQGRFCRVCGNAPASIVVASQKGLTISRFFVYGSVVLVVLLMVGLRINLIVRPEASTPAKSDSAGSAQPSEVRQRSMSTYPLVIGHIDAKAQSGRIAFQSTAGTCGE
jgi:hypothetical protein